MATVSASDARPVVGSLAAALVLLAQALDVSMSRLVDAELSTALELVDRVGWRWSS